MMAMTAEEEPERGAIVVVGIRIVGVVGRIAVVDPVAPAMQIPAMPIAAARPVDLVNV
jgi:hypothetical protein